MFYETSMGRILEIYKLVDPGTITQGPAAVGLVSGRGCTGGNGTFANWDNGERHIYVKVFVYADKCCHYIDILDEVLNRTGWDRLTEGRIQRLNDANSGNKVLFERWHGGEWQFADLDSIDYTV